jgi:uncharacterized protein YbjT (DUF2867 family)
MRITIFGATGGTGKQLVEQALAEGNEVVAYVRNPSKLDMSNKLLTVVQGELSDHAAIEQAVNGADAVISVLGPRGSSEGKPITKGTQNILDAMKKRGVRRFIVSSTASASDPNDSFDFKFKFLVALIKLAKHAAYEDIVSVADTVRKSDRDWTIVRLPLLNNKPKSGKVKVGYYGTGIIGTYLSRADLAEFMLAQVNDLKYLHQAPAISN